MNWMTSGRHRALRSRRGRRLQISRFPGLQRRQQPCQPRVGEQETRNENGNENGNAGGKPWYCRSITDDAESHGVDFGGGFGLGRWQMVTLLVFCMRKKDVFLLEFGLNAPMQESQDAEVDSATLGGGMGDSYERRKVFTTSKMTSTVTKEEEEIVPHGGREHMLAGGFLRSPDPTPPTSEPGLQLFEWVS